MILYNTLMGVSAGLALILVPLLMRKLYWRIKIAPEGWAISLGVLGVILTVLGGLMATTWPLSVNQPINIAFAEPNVMLGLLLIAASLFLWQRRELVASIGDGVKKTADEAFEYLRRVMMPVSWVVFALGLILLACTAAIWRFTLVGSAPEAEPITGLLHDYPAAENAFFVILYGLSALGALVFPFALRSKGSGLRKVVGYSWAIAGVLFLLFSAMNYYTHIGLLVNLLQGKDFEF